MSGRKYSITSVHHKKVPPEGGKPCDVYYVLPSLSDKLARPRVGAGLARAPYYEAQTASDAVAFGAAVPCAIQLVIKLAG